MALLVDGLLPASFRGAPFAVLSDEVAGGRRIALHQYFGREGPWAEDIGREARRFRFRGFIVDNDVVFAGGPIQLQRALLLAALEKSGPGTLVHPTLGILNVSLSRFAMGADLGAATLSSLDLEFVESGKQQFPTSLLSTSSGLLSAANLATLALAADAVRAVALVSTTVGARKTLSTSAAAWASTTKTLGADATALTSLAADLPGNYGRFARGANSGASGTNDSIYSDSTTVEDLIAAASSARTAIAAACRTLGAAIAAAALTDVSEVAGAVSALVAALADACADPADTIRLLEELAENAPTRAEVSAAAGAPIGRMIRRAVAAQLASACGAYQPSSSEDAAALINRMAGLLDDISTEAADAGEDASYTAVRSIRSAIVQDLRRRAGTLAHLRIVTTVEPRPSLALAQSLYRDASRADELERRAVPIHPLFMPTSFQALAR